MEFPNLGENCSVSTCRMLDFLPLRCSGCHGVFCKDHYLYDNHNCKSPDIKNKQVPVCPLCGAIVPLRPGELPDVQVGNHIDAACRSKPALELKGKLFSNACCMPRCKKKELVPFTCDRCKLNFCVSHRNELDHACKGFQGNQNSSRKLSAAGAAAIYRAVFNSSNNSNNASSKGASSINKFQSGTTSSDENSHKKLQEEEDFQLALALSASLSNESPLQSSRSTPNNTSQKSPSCSIS